MPIRSVRKTLEFGLLRVVKREGKEEHEGILAGEMPAE
jgi:hypothetical protein